MADGGSGTPRNSLGRHSVVPNTISAAERPTPSAGLREAMHGIEDLSTEMMGDDDLGVTQRYITQQTLGSNFRDLEHGIRGQRLHLVTQQLSRR